MVQAVAIPDREATALFLNAVRIIKSFLPDMHVQPITVWSFWLAIKRKNAVVHVYSDSSYVVKAVNEGWLQKWIMKGLEKQKNPDLWQRFLKIYRKHNVTFFWVKGHAGHPENERCDKLAVEAALSGNLLEDTGYSPLD